MIASAPYERSRLIICSQLRKLIHIVRSSPQRRQAWLQEVALHQQSKGGDSKTALMLILDVRTRWSSTHQMLRKFISADDQSTLHL
jgi:hypothetical protein